MKLIEHDFAHWGFTLFVSTLMKGSRNNNYFGLICSLKNLLTLFAFSSDEEPSALSIPWMLVPTFLLLDFLNEMFTNFVNLLTIVEYHEFNQL